MDTIVKLISQTITPTDESQVTVQLINKLEINIPIWYLHHNGHFLEDSIVKTFPKLNELKRGREEALKLEIINQVIDDIPEMVSIDILNLFIQVQKI